MISWPAACGIRWVKPSMATVSPSCTAALMASESDVSCAIAYNPANAKRIYGPYRAGSNGVTADGRDANGLGEHVVSATDFHDRSGARAANEPRQDADRRAADHRHSRRPRARAGAAGPPPPPRHRLAERAPGRRSPPH